MSGPWPDPGGQLQPDPRTDDLAVDHLFAVPEPGADGDILDDLNPDSLTVLDDSKLEPALAGTNSSEPVQFERQGYFCLDPDATPDHPVFNRTVGLRDSWARMQKSK